MHNQSADMPALACTQDMFHAISRVFTSCSPGSTPIISPPESLTVFPSLGKNLPNVNGGVSNGHGTGTPSIKEGEVLQVPEVEEFESVKSRLDSDSMFMIAIDENKARLTLAGAGTLVCFSPAFEASLLIFPLLCINNGKKVLDRFVFLLCLDSHPHYDTYCLVSPFHFPTVRKR